MSQNTGTKSELSRSQVKSEERQRSNSSHIFTKMLRQVLGLRDDVPMPKPLVLLDMFARSRPIAMVKGSGVSPSDILRSLATQGVLESLEPNSRLSYTASVNHGVAFCVMIDEITPGVIPVEDQLKVAEDCAMQWLT